MKYILTFFYGFLFFSSINAAVPGWNLYDEGLLYLKEIEKSNPEWIKKISATKEEGAPPLYTYNSIGQLSPCTLGAVKIFCDLQEEFSEKLPHMHLVEVYHDRPKLEKLIHNFIDIASFKSIRADHYVPGQEDVVLITGVVTDLEDIISSVPYGFINGVTTEDDLSVNRIIHQVLSSEKKGKCVFYEVNKEFEHYRLTWKPSLSSQPTALSTPFPYIPKIKTKNHLFITYSLSGGRLGDNLLAYSRAKWVAMKFGLPLINKQFNQFKNFQLSQYDYPLSFQFKVKRKKPFKHLDLVPKAKKNTMISIPYFPEYPWRELSPKKEFSHFKVEWDHPLFKQELTRCLSPKEPVDLVPLPKDKITIALHVRRGGLVENFDDLNIGFPLKAPNNEYYIRLLKKTCEIFTDRQIYVYLFTDSHEPQVLCKEYAERLSNPQITFDWNREKSSVMRDFVSIGEFDCLIRSGSNFSFMAGKRGDYIIEATPLEARVETKKSFVTKYEMIF